MLDMLIDITKYLDKLNEETIEEKIIKEGQEREKYMKNNIKKHLQNTQKVL